MGKHTGKPAAHSYKTFWLLFFLMTLSLINGCQSQDSKPSATTNKSNQLIKKPTTRAEWRHLLGWKEDCEQAFNNTHAADDAGIAPYTLGDADELVMVMCAVGSYQPSFLLYRLNQQIPSALFLETYQSDDAKTLKRSMETELWGEFVFNAETKELVILNASRQTKDCGTWAKYSFNTDNMGKLQEFRSQLTCPDHVKEPLDGELTFPPAGWKPIK